MGDDRGPDATLTLLEQIVWILPDNSNLLDVFWDCHECS